MLKRNGAIIKSVSGGSIAEEMGFMPGDEILEINGQKLRDIIDYRFFISEDNISLLLKREGEKCLFEIEKDSSEEMGIDFTSDLFDGLIKCRNKCIFCFVDQTPRGMRKELYIKDDDYRLSFLYGNFITLNNTGEEDLRRIVNLRLSPLYISVHSLSPAKRKLLFGIRKNDHIYEKLKFLAEGNIRLHTQVVVCPGINDGEELDDTIKKLGEFYPEVQSLAIVPAGLTRHREGLYPLKPFDVTGATGIINQVEHRQKYFRGKINTNFVFLADEFYIMASKPFPPYEHYEGFPQLENGVGMAVNFLSPLFSAIEKKEFRPVRKKNKKFTLVSGLSSFPVLSRLEDIFRNIPGLEADTVYCRNRFWGESVTVSGLLTGQDIYNTLKERNYGDEIFISENTVRPDGVFLDDLTLEELSSSLKRPVKWVSGSALDLLKVMGVVKCRYR